jgi:hypothetical protein
MRKIRFAEAEKIAKHLKQEYARDMSWFEDAVAGKHDIWKHMLALDRKGLMTKYS